MNKPTETYWTAFYTKPRNEKKVAGRLQEQGFTVYCPCQTLLKQWSDRKKKVSEPVFTSYLFAQVDEQSRQEILKDSGVVSNVRWLGQPAHIREEEIVCIKQFLNSHAEVSFLSTSFNGGDEVMIAGGALAGQEGVLEWVRGGKALLKVEALGLVLQAELGLHHLTKKRDIA